MCGIVALFSPRGTVALGDLERATRRLSQRGPGRAAAGWLRTVASGWATPGSASSTWPPATSRSPARTSALRIVVNGEFYDFERIQRDLEARGHRLRTRSDSEIALHLYEDLGPRLPAAAARRVRLRPLGRPNRHALRRPRPLRHQAALLRAARRHALPGLRGQGAVRGRASRPAGTATAFFQANHFLAPPQDRTLFEGVQPGAARPLPAGDRRADPADPLLGLRLPGGRATARRRWPTPSTPSGSAHALDEAVRLRLRADVPVGCYLSGGLDSCAVLGLAARAPRRSDPGLHADLRPGRLRRGGHRPRDGGARRGRVPPDPDPPGRPRRPFRRRDLAQPRRCCFNAHGVAKYLLSRAVRDAGYKVVLTGEGVRRDPRRLPALPPRHAALQPRRAGPRGGRAQLLDELEASNPVSRGLLLPDGEAGLSRAWSRDSGFVPSWLEAYAASGVEASRGLLRADFAAEFGERDAYRRCSTASTCRGQLAGREPVNQSLYLWSKTVLPSYILTVLGDRMEMAHSVEGRVPFLDHHVVELRSHAGAQKIRGMTEKYVLREAARPVLTETVYGRQKHPFLTPPAALNPGRAAARADAGHAARPCDGVAAVLRQAQSDGSAGHTPVPGRWSAHGNASYLVRGASTTVVMLSLAWAASFAWCGAGGQR